MQNMEKSNLRTSLPADLNQVLHDVRVSMETLLPTKLRPLNTSHDLEFKGRIGQLEYHQMDARDVTTVVILCCTDVESGIFFRHVTDRQP